MKIIDVQASLSNLTQLDKHQHDVHRSPGVNQQQNSVIDREAVAQRLEMPVQPDQTEGKIADPRDRNRQQAGQRKKRSKKTAQHPASAPAQSSTRGHFVDVDA